MLRNSKFVTVVELRLLDASQRRATLLVVISFFFLLFSSYFLFLFLNILLALSRRGDWLSVLASSRDKSIRLCCCAQPISLWFLLLFLCDCLFLFVYYSFCICLFSFSLRKTRLTNWITAWSVCVSLSVCSCAPLCNEQRAMSKEQRAMSNEQQKVAWCVSKDEPRCVNRSMRNNNSIRDESRRRRWWSIKEATGKRWNAMDKSRRLGLARNGKDEVWLIGVQGKRRQMGNNEALLSLFHYRWCFSQSIGGSIGRKKERKQCSALLRATLKDVERDAMKRGGGHSSMIVWFALMSKSVLSAHYFWPSFELVNFWRALRLIGSDGAKEKKRKRTIKKKQTNKCRLAIKWWWSDANRPSTSALKMPHRFGGWMFAIGEGRWRRILWQKRRHVCVWFIHMTYSLCLCLCLSLSPFICVCISRPFSNWK